MIEGYNGVGKTASIRLLELCTGVQPFLDQNAVWSSLRANLGSARIRAEDLAGATSIEWRFDSRTWAATPEAVDDNFFDCILIDGMRARLTDVQSLLEVHRIAGDVTLKETLARQIESYVNKLERLWARFLEKDGTAQVAIDLLGSVESVTRRASESVLRSAISEKEEADKRVQEASEKLASISNRLTLLEDATGLRKRLALLQETAPRLDQELAAVEQELELAEDNRDELSGSLREAEVRAAASEDAERQLKNAIRTADRNQGHLTAARDRLAEALAAAGLESYPKNLGEAIHGRQVLLDQLMRRRADLDATPLLQRLLADLVARLAQAVEAGLGDQIALTDEDTGLSTSVHQLTVQLQRQMELLPTAGDVDSTATRSLDNEIARETNRIQVIENLPTLLRDVERRERLLEQAAKRVADLTERQTPESDNIRRIRQELEGLDGRILELSTRRAILRGQKDDILEGQDPQELADRLSHLLREADTSLDRLELDQQASAQAGRVANEALTAARTAAQECTNRLAAARTDLNRAVTLLNEADEYAFLRASSIPLPRPLDDEETQTAHLAELTRKSSAASNHLQNIPLRLREMIASLRNIAGAVRGLKVSDGEYTAQLTRWLEERFTGWFNQPTVASALFRDAESINVDLTQQAILWRTAAGEQSIRPFDAFSSGEQAFAYTRAQLEALGSPSAGNRLIALDEFAAFVAHDRRDDLRRLLLERSERYPTEKTVLILPVTQDYGSSGGTSVDSLSEEHSRRAAALDTEDAYFAEEFRG
ncbi:hypothetical protein [Microbispora sp. CA-102843]|uniref:hypothetical protein n=1 Tax=Microbispora sp. CA-102843 TaxID=3239952 RepID=UPI003D89D0BE